MDTLTRKTIPALLIFVFACVAAASETLEKQQQALDAIADFADRICHKVDTDGGETESLELSGSAKIELSKILKVIADLGIEGGAKYQKTEYNNVLQKDLAGLMIESSKCRLNVFNGLKDKLLDTTSSSTGATSSVIQTTTGHKSPAVSNVTGNVTIEINDSDTE